MKPVLCHGVFDVLHVGHIDYLKKAKSYGDCLVVSITSDRYVNKGPGRPVFKQEQRMRMLSELECVDVVYINDNPTAVEAIEKFKPKYYIKGPDYKNKDDDPTGGIYQEAKAVKDVGGELICLDLNTYSSSALINQFFSAMNYRQKSYVNLVNKIGGIAAVEDSIQRLENLRVCVVGENIVDKYIFCKPQGISSKSPSVSAEFKQEELYEGGAKAVFKAVQQFCKSSSQVTPLGQYAEKIRYIDPDTNSRMFELTNIHKEVWADGQNEKKTYNSARSRKSDCYILCDFGHGMFNQKFLHYIKNLPGFVCLNAQTNSSNMPFNPYTKHRRFDYLSLDLREAQIAFHDNVSSPLDLFMRVVTDRGVRVSMTRGRNGSFFSVNPNEVKDCPAFADRVVDPTGAGDAYFAITSLLNAIGADPVLIPFIGNVYAGLATKIIGNKDVVGRADLIKAMRSILK